MTEKCKCLIGQLHVPGFLDQLGDFSLLHGSKSAVFSWQYLTRIGRVLGESLLIQKSIIFGVSAFRSLIFFL